MNAIRSATPSGSTRSLLNLSGTPMTPGKIEIGEHTLKGVKLNMKQVNKRTRVDEN